MIFDLIYSADDLGLDLLDGLRDEARRIVARVRRVGLDVVRDLGEQDDVAHTLIHSLAHLFHDRLDRVSLAAGHRVDLLVVVFCVQEERVDEVLRHHAAIARTQ